MQAAAAPPPAVVSPPPLAARVASTATVAAGTAGPVDRLSGSLLASIFSLLPLGPRLRAVSLVSKRWRRLVLSSLPALAVARTANLDEDAEAIFGLAPGLSDLRISSWSFSVPIALPATLTSLTLLHERHLASLVKLAPFQEGWTLSCRFTPPLPPLQRLSIDAFITDSWTVPLLRATSSSITDLHLESHKFCSPLLECLMRTTFPRLVSLAITERQLVATTRDLLRRSMDRWSPFLEAHCSQLVSLSFDTFALATLETELSNLLTAVVWYTYPRLRTLHLGGPASTNQIQSLLSGSPLLDSASLAVPLPELLAVQPPTLLSTRLTRFALRPFRPRLGTHPQLRSLLRLVPRLHLEGAAFVTDCAPLVRLTEARYAHCVRDLMLASVTLHTRSLLALLSNFPNLHHLQIEEISTDPIADQDIRSLSALRSLDFYSTGTRAWKDISKFLRLFLRLAPRLTSLSFGFPSRPLPESVSDLRELLVEASRHPSVHYVTITTSAAPQLLALPHFDWLCVRMEAKDGLDASVEAEVHWSLRRRAPQAPAVVVARKPPPVMGARKPSPVIAARKGAARTGKRVAVAFSDSEDEEEEEEEVSDGDAEESDEVRQDSDASDVDD